MKVLPQGEFIAEFEETGVLLVEEGIDLLDALSQTTLGIVA